MFELMLGIAGTAKNTGKTTATAAIINELRLRGLPFFLTSIGYDGENIDNVTGLPKPKLRVQPGDTVVTARRCLQVSTARLEVLAWTGIPTPLGEVAVTRVVGAGLAVTAGPNKSTELRRLNAVLRELGPGILLVDGALNRIAPMAETDGFILSTGAARTPNIPRLAQETEQIWRLSTLPLAPGSAALSALGLRHAALLNEDLVECRRLPSSSLLSEDDCEALLSGGAPAGGFLVVPGIAGVRALRALAARAESGCRGYHLVFSDPVKLLAAGEPVAHHELLAALAGRGVAPCVLRRVPLIAVTVNPFYPEYRFESKTYRPAFVDFQRLQVSVQAAVRTPVFNVMKQGGAALVDTFLRHARRAGGSGTVEF